MKASGDDGLLQPASGTPLPRHSATLFGWWIAVGHSIESSDKAVHPCRCRNTSTRHRMRVCVCGPNLVRRACQQGFSYVLRDLGKQPIQIVYTECRCGVLRPAQHQTSEENLLLPLCQTLANQGCKSSLPMHMTMMPLCAIVASVSCLLLASLKSEMTIKAQQFRHCAASASAHPHWRPII